MDVVTSAKNIAAVLATTSTLAYVFGYLALRARAYVLGTDPAFTLIDEGYVFAGFRFIFITLIVLLLTAPIILLIRSASLWFISRLPNDFIYPVQWLFLGLLALLTILALKIFSAKDLLLQQANADNSSLLFKEAILGGHPAVSLVLTFLNVILATLLVLWLLKVRLSNSNGMFVWVLGIVTSIQIVLVPIYHGALFADRKVRVLASIPDAVKGVVAPLGIIDRKSEHVTLMGCDAEGNRRLVTIKLDDLNGISIKKIVSINEFLKKDIGAHSDSRVKDADGLVSRYKRKESYASEQTKGIKAMSSNESDVNKSFFETLVDYLRITFEAIGSLGDSAVDAGQLWLVEVGASGTPSKLHRIGSFHNLSWPVVGPDGTTIYALQQGQVVRVGKDDHSIESIHTDLHWIKLLGVTQDYSVLGFVNEGNETKPAILTNNGEVRVSRSPLSGEDKERKSRLLQEARTYTGGKVLFVERSERGGQGFDVFLKSGEEVINLSDCGNDRCGQASLSHDFRLALFIRQPRY